MEKIELPAGVVKNILAGIFHSIATMNRQKIEDCSIHVKARHSFG
jgi:hypothetical protein